MVSVLRRPAPALAPFVDVVWYVDEPALSGRELAIPTGGMQLVFNLREDVLHWYDGEGLRAEHTTRGSGLCGAIVQPVGIDTVDQRLCVGVGFRPGGAAPFFHPPAYALAEPVIDLETLWGHDGALLRERLLEQHTPEDALQALERALLERVVRADVPLRSGPGNGAPDPGIVHAVAALSNGSTVGHVVEQLGLTSSSFQRRFRTAVGLNPKPFARVQRLQRVLRTVNGQGDVDWAGVAVQFGYFDQSHLINEFRALTGGTPTAYRPRSRGEHNHVPLTR